MFDSEKIDLIREMIKEFLDNCNVSEDSVICMLNAIATVIDFKRKD